MGSYGFIPFWGANMIVFKPLNIFKKILGLGIKYTKNTGRHPLLPCDLEDSEAL